MSGRTALIVTCLAMTIGACIRIGPAPVDPGGCESALDSVVMTAARNAVIDRHGENRLRLPVADTLPPVLVHDDKLCRAAAAGYAEDRLPAGVPRRAAVVRAGGLYFVIGRTPVNESAPSVTPW